MTVIQAGIAALVVSALSSPLVLKIVAGRIMDVPNTRSSHETPTPRGGGLAVIAATAAGVAFLRADWTTPMMGAVAVAVGFGLVGLADDMRGIGVGPRLAAQLIIAGGAARLLLEGGSWLVVVLIVWIVGFTNAFNFMDGIDGIASAQLIVAGAAWAVLGTIESEDLLTGLGLITVAAALGFVPWNFPRARMFMGDVGSYFSGAWLAALAVIGIRLGVSALAVLAPLALFGADTGVTLLMRIGRGEEWHQAHRDHVYQRLVIGGWSHSRTTLAYAGLATLIAAAGIGTASASVLASTLGTALLATLVLTYFALPWWQDRHG